MSRFFHCTSFTPKIGQTFVLVPGATNMYGFGVYCAPSPEWQWGMTAISFEMDKALVQFNHDGNYCLLSKGLVLKATSSKKLTSDYYDDGKQIVFCKVVKIIEGEPVSALSDDFINDRSMPSAKAVEAREQKMRVTFLKRLAGLVLGLVCWVKFILSAEWKWYALGRFLLGIGGTFEVPTHVAKDIMGGQVNMPDGHDNKLSVRPRANTQLFWIVGGMTVTVENSIVDGNDVYDFHPQPGQGVLANRRDKGYAGYAWSGRDDDPTQIKLSPRLTAWVWKVAKFLHIDYTHLRMQDDHLIFSNSLWNALGGKPFTSHVHVTVAEVSDKTPTITWVEKLHIWFEQVQLLIHKLFPPKGSIKIEQSVECEEIPF